MAAVAVDFSLRSSSSLSVDKQVGLSWTSWRKDKDERSLQSLSLTVCVIRPIIEDKNHENDCLICHTG